MTTHSIKSQIYCRKIENASQYGGRQVPMKWFKIKYARRGNGSYQLAVTSLSNQNYN